MKQAGNKNFIFLFLPLEFLFVCITYQINFSAVLLKGGMQKQQSTIPLDEESVIENGWNRALGAQFYWIVFRKENNYRLL